MDCYKLMELRKIDDKNELKKVQDTAKATINFLHKNNLPFTPINYDEWFYVICRALDEKHILSDKNLKVLYEKYKVDMNKELYSHKEEISEISKHLEDVNSDSNLILERVNGNISEHSEMLSESIEAIDNQDIEKIEALKKKIEALKKENQVLKSDIKNLQDKLKIVEERLNKTKEEADLDALTKVFSRKKFEKDIKEFEKIYPLYSVIFLDVDHFKKINDTFGHKVGDEVLKELGDILRNYVRRNTYVYRYGGEEFVIVLPQVDKNIAKIVAERLRKVIEQRRLKIGSNTLNFTASFGVAQKEDSQSFEDVIQRADEALYEAKKSGRNRVVVK